MDRLVEGALRSPTAGNTGGTAWVVLEGAEETAVYFDATTDEDWRAHYRDWIDGLQRAPVVLLAYTSPDVYVSRYAEPDKADAGLGEGGDRWPVPLLVRPTRPSGMAVAPRRRGRRVGPAILGNTIVPRARRSLRPD